MAEERTRGGHAIRLLEPLLFGSGIQEYDGRIDVHRMRFSRSLLFDELERAC